MMKGVLAMINMIASFGMLARFPVTLGFGFKDGLPVAGVMLLIAWALMRLRSKQRTNRSLATPQEIIERNRQARGMKGNSKS